MLLAQVKPVWAVVSLAFAAAVFFTELRVPTPVPPAREASLRVVAAAYAADTVECSIPGQIRRLGRSTYMSRRAVIRTTPADCEQRGGEYIVPLETVTAPSPSEPVPEAGPRPAPRTTVARPAPQPTPTPSLPPPARKPDPETIIVLDDYGPAVGAGEADLTALRDAEDRQRQDLNQLRRERDQMTAELDLLRKQGEELAEQHARLRDKIATDASAGDEERAQLEHLAQQASVKRGEISDLQSRLAQQVSALSESERALASVEGAIERKTAELAARTEEIEDARRQRDHLLDQLAHLREQVENEESNLERLRDDREALRLARERIDEEKRSLAASREQRDDLEAERASLREQSAQLAEERAKLLTEIGAGRDATERERAELERLEDLARAKTEELGRVENQLGEKQGELDRIEQALVARERDLAEKEVKLLARADELDMLRDNLDARQQELEEREKELEQQQIELASLATRGVSEEGRRIASASQIDRKTDFGKYYALVIGNNEYVGLRSLETAVNDARKVAEILQARYDFEVELVENAQRYHILSALNRLQKNLTENDNLLIYFAGHGHIDRRNLRGYWLPVDAEPESNANWISNTAVTDIINNMSARHVMVVADSCYSGVLTRSVVTSDISGMSAEKRLQWIQTMVSKRSRTALTSGGEKPIVDNIGGSHSIFAQAFIDVLTANDGPLEGHRLFRELRARVAESAGAAGLDQVPEYAPIHTAGHADGDFFFVPRLAGSMQAISQAEPRQP